MARNFRRSSRLTPYARGVTRQQVVAFLNLTDERVTERGHLTMRDVQAEAVKHQQGKRIILRLFTNQQKYQMTPVVAFHSPDIDASMRMNPRVPIIGPPKQIKNPLDAQLSEDSDESNTGLTPESVEQEISPTPIQSLSSSSDGCDEEEAAESQDQIRFSSDSSDEA